MSQLKEFYQLIKTDTELQQKLASAKDLPSGVVELGKTKGYSFTIEEVEREVEIFMGKREEGELVDEELEAIAGGRFGGSIKKESYNEMIARSIAQQKYFESIGICFQNPLP